MVKKAFIILLCTFIISSSLQFISVPEATAEPLFIVRMDYITGGRDPISVSVGDFDGDGVQDHAVANAHSDNV